MIVINIIILANIFYNLESESFDLLVPANNNYSTKNLKKLVLLRLQFCFKKILKFCFTSDIFNFSLSLIIEISSENCFEKCFTYNQ